MEKEKEITFYEKGEKEKKDEKNLMETRLKRLPVYKARDETFDLRNHQSCF